MIFLINIRQSKDESRRPAALNRQHALRSSSQCRHQVYAIAGVRHGIAADHSGHASLLQHAIGIAGKQRMYGNADGAAAPACFSWPVAATMVRAVEAISSTSTGVRPASSWGGGSDTATS
jgi:hypothetical protein